MLLAVLATGFVVCAAASVIVALTIFFVPHASNPPFTHPAEKWIYNGSLALVIAAGVFGFGAMLADTRADSADQAQEPRSATAQSNQEKP